MAKVCEDDATATTTLGDSTPLIYYKESLTKLCTIGEFNSDNGYVESDFPHAKVPIVGITSIRSLEEGVADAVVLTIDGVDVDCNPVSRCYPAAEENAARLAYEELGFKNILPCIHVSRFESCKIANLPL